MVDLPVPNPALARKVWESMTNPSTRRVARKLRQAGLSTSHETINRWRRGGWRQAERVRHPLDVAREALDDAVPVLTSDPMTTAKVLVDQSAERERLERLTDGKLLRETARAIAMATIMVARVLMRQAAIVLSKPVEVGVLMRALAGCAQAATAGLAQALAMQAAAQGGEDHGHRRR